MALISGTLRAISDHIHVKANCPYFTNNVYTKAKDKSKGEDAYYMSNTMICIADGVGGWNAIGVDPSKYSTELILNYSSLYQKQVQSNEKICNDVALFAKSCHQTQSIGSSTFCSLRIDKIDHSLKSINLGDSGYMLIRKDKILFRSKEQQHSFNFPFQVGTNGDLPMLAEVNSHKIEQGDMIILATDGLWDNMYKEQLLRLINQSKKNKIANENIAMQIGDLCYQNSIKHDFLSPFSKNSNLNYFGGKPDDITIILAEINCLIKH